MEVKLVITATKDDDPVNTVGKEYFFTDIMTISIGRGEPNNIPLTDPGRTVSRNHAKLIASDDCYLLEDLQSKNFTFLNEERLETGQQRKLKNGDTISVGDFSIEYFYTASPEDLGVTILDPVFNEPDYSKDNPFIDDVADLFASFERLCELFDTSSLASKTEYLTHAINVHKPSSGTHKVANLFKNALSDTQIPVAAASMSEATSKPKVIQPTTKPGPAVTRVLDTTLESLKELIRIPYEFRGEFIGHTMWQDEESTFLYEGDYQTTKNYLLSNAADEAELDRKLARLKKAAEKVKVHQVGMMQGYMAVVREGVQQVLLQLDPNVYAEEILGSSMLFKILPFLGSKRVLETMDGKIAEIKQSDWSVTEQRLYRPIFIGAYMSTSSDEAET